MAPDGPDPATLRDIVTAVHKLKEQKHEVSIVVGGGETARKYIAAAVALGVPNVVQDQIGIAATRLNAKMLISALGDIAESEPLTTFEKAVRANMKNKIPVMGGTTPGQTTDAVAAMLAQVSHSEILIVVTNVDGVYTADPKLDPDAKKIERMTTRDLAKLLAKDEFKPGMKTILDPIAVSLLGRFKAQTLVLGKHEIKRLPEILKGGKHTGTTITWVE